MKQESNTSKIIEIGILLFVMAGMCSGCKLWDLLKPDNPPVDPPEPIPAFVNPVTGPNLPGTHSEDVRWKWQEMDVPHHGHPAGDDRVKINMPSYAIDHQCATKDGSTIVLKFEDGTSMTLKPYAIDQGDPPLSNRLKAEWWLPRKAGKIVVQLWCAGKQLMQVTVPQYNYDRQANLKDWE